MVKFFQWFPVFKCSSVLLRTLHNLTLTHLLSVVSNMIPRRWICTPHSCQKYHAILHFLCICLGYSFADSFHQSLCGQLHHPTQSILLYKVSRCPASSFRSLFSHYAFSYADLHHWLLPNRLFYIWLPESLFQGNLCFTFFFICICPGSVLSQHGAH